MARKKHLSKLSHEQTIAAIVEEIRTVEPDLERGAIRDVVLSVATVREKHTMLLRYFDQWPDLLTSGDARLPAFAQRLIAQLALAGSQAVVRPRCAICDGAKLLPRVLPDGRRACANCGRERTALATAEPSCAPPRTS